MQEVTSTPDGQNLNESEDSPQALANEANTAQSGPSPPTVAAGAQGRDRATPPAGSSQDGRASDSPSNGSPLSGQAQRATPVPAAAAALELPNGAWTTAPVVPKAEPGRSLPEAVRSFDEGSLEKKPGDTEADRPPAVAEKDRQVWEMSQRARAAALDSPPPPGLLSQALAYIMAQVRHFLPALYDSWSAHVLFEVSCKLHVVQTKASLAGKGCSACRSKGCMKLLLI